jgi:hypothetical protein
MLSNRIKELIRKQKYSYLDGYSFKRISNKFECEFKALDRNIIEE